MEEEKMGDYTGLGFSAKLSLAKLYSASGTIVRIKGDLSEKFKTTVIQTTSNPKPSWLCEARSIFKHTICEELPSLLEKKESNEDLARTLCNLTVTKFEKAQPLIQFLSDGVDQDEKELYEAFLYLLDEYDQLEKGSVHIVSTKTGKVIASLGPESFWKPSARPREYDNLLSTRQPELEILPEIKAYFTLVTFEEERDASLLENFIAKLHQTDLLRQEGDGRTQLITKEGRKQLALGLMNYNTLDLLNECTSTFKTLLNQFHVTTDYKSYDASFFVEGLFNVQVELNVADVTTLSSRFNPRFMYSRLADNFVRDIFKKLGSTLAKDKRAIQWGAIEGNPFRRDDIQVWVTAPELYKEFCTMVVPTTSIAIIDDCPIMGIKGKLGTLVLTPFFEVGSKEILDCWQVRTTVGFRVYLDKPDNVCTIPVEGVTYQGVVESLK